MSDSFQTSSSTFLELSDLEAQLSSINIKTKIDILPELRRYMNQNFNSYNKISHIYWESQKAMLNVFSKLSYINSEGEIIAVKCTPANPERTIAKIKQKDNIILPIITISQPKSSTDDKRRKYEQVLVYESIWNEKAQRAQRVISFSPLAINIEYNLHIWSKYRANLDQLAHQIRMHFNPGMILVTPGNDETKAFLLDDSDESTLNPGDREDRVLRRRFVISVETYLPSVKFLLTSTGRIEQFKVESQFYNDSNNL